MTRVSLKLSQCAW